MDVNFINDVIIWMERVCDVEYDMETNDEKIPNRKPET